MKFDLSKIEFSKRDISRNIKLPIKLTENLAEFMGIIMGDGHLSHYRGYFKGRKYVQYEIHITGNVSETEYLRYRGL